MACALLCAVGGLPAAARAQVDGLSLDLTGEPAAESDRIVVAPPYLPSGAVDLVAYRNLLAALAGRYGARLVPEQQTLAAIRERKLKPAALRSTVGVRWLARQLEAKRVIVFTASGREVEVRVFGSLAESPDLEWKQPWVAKLGRAKAAEMAAGLIEKADSELTPPAPPPIPERAVSAYSDPLPAPIQQVAVGDVEAELRREAALEEAAGQRVLPVLFAALGAGASTRDLRVSGGEGLAPVQSSAAPGLGLYLALHPLQLAKGLADEAWSELLLEGHLRRGLVKATVRGGAQDGRSFPVDDDELLARLSWRWRFGQGLPAVGLGVGWGTERASLDPSLPAVSTRYQALSLLLRAQQPILAELLGVELMGGPRLLQNGEGADSPGTSWEAEAWLTSQPAGPLFARAGARVSSTQVGRADGLEVRDLRAFFALELGVFVR
jgi:hypothetical protein